MRFRVPLVAAVMTAVLVAVLVATGGQAAAAARWLVLSPDTGPAGSTVTVSGYGFDYQECVARAVLYWSGYERDAQVVVLDDTTTGPSFTATMPVPADALPGDLVLHSLCGHGELSEPGPSATFLVVEPEAEAEPSVTLSPEQGPPGSTVEVSGTGFAKCGATTSLRWAGHGDEVFADIDPDTGEFHRELRVPESAEPGSLAVETECAGVGAWFTVEPSDGGSSSGQPPTTTTNGSSGGGQPPPTVSDALDPGQGGGGEGGAGGGSGDDAADDGGARVHPVLMTGTLPLASEMRLDPEVLLAAALLAALLILLIAFPAELFNKTYEKNKEEIHDILARVGLRGDRFPSWLGLVLFLGLGTALSVLLAGSEGAAGNPVAQVIGFLVAIPLVTFAYGWPAELYARGRTRVPGLLEVLPPALLVAVVCAALSTLLALDPPYLYGLFAGFVTVRPRVLSTRDEGRAILLGALCLVVCAAAAFAIWGLVHPMAHGGAPTWPAVVADAVLFWVFVLATESLVFALPPLLFLDGRKLWEWHLVYWLVPQAVAVAAFTYVFVLRGQLSPPEGGTAAVVKALAFFVVFGLLSVAVWRYFKWPNRPTLRAGSRRASY